MVDAACLLKDNIAQDASRLAEVESVTTEDSKLRFGDSLVDSLITICISELVLFISDYFLWAPPTATVTTVIHSHYGP